MNYSHNIQIICNIAGGRGYGIPPGGGRRCWWVWGDAGRESSARPLLEAARSCQLEQQRKQGTEEALADAGGFSTSNGGRMNTMTDLHAGGLTSAGHPRRT